MGYLSTHWGEIAALLTAFFWTITALAFESASLKVGSLSVNLIRLFLGFIFLSIANLVRRGMVFPTDAGTEAWIWLSLSGLVGFVFGDLFLFKSYTLIGSRLSMLIMTLAPPMTALMGWIILNEKLSLLNWLGMTLTFAGICMAIFGKQGKGGRLKFNVSSRGLLFAFFGALGQALGLILSKIGMKDYDPFAATQVRIISGLFGFALIVTIMRRWDRIRSAISNRSSMASIGVGSFFGPFLGVAFSLVAIQKTATGIASTLMSIVPVLIIPPAIILFRQKVSLLEIAGAVISVAGVALFFL